jgi:hypothetical protein
LAKLAQAPATEALAVSSAAMAASRIIRA